MNNKGVTLIELLIVIVVIGIISAFAVPAVGKFLENAEKTAILQDAIAVEVAAENYCAYNSCASNETLTWDELKDYLGNFNAEYYQDCVLGDTTTIARLDATSGDWIVWLERAGGSGGGNSTSDWEWTNRLPDGTANPNPVSPRDGSTADVTDD